jgi:hypothetical protein
MADPIAVEATRSSTRETNLRWTWSQVENALRDLQFGTITLVVQDGVVVQVERTERQRYQRAAQKPNLG